MKLKESFARVSCITLSAAGIALMSPVAAQATDNNSRPFLPRLIISSTIPGNGDLNPYGIAFVPAGFPQNGTIASGDILVSNFNNSSNLQGTGTTIIKLTPDGSVAPSVPAGESGNATTIFSSKLNGLTTALGVLSGGFIFVGNVPTQDGTIGTISNGALQVLDRQGNLLTTLTDAVFLDSPWDLTISDHGTSAQVFVSNVLSGTVSRLDLTVGSSNITVMRKTQIAQGYTHVPNAAALVLGPTGLAYDESTDVLYVASTADNAIFSIPHAGTASGVIDKGTLVFSDTHLRGPLALAFAPNGNLLTSNGDAVNPDPTHPSEIVEFTKGGEFVRQYNVDAGQGAAFGITTALPGGGPGFNFAAVNDATNAFAVYGLAPFLDKFASDGK
ncbi:conserved hypothetical protein [Beijerinckia indica subsp. indica ATCC 9039]|uniref:NHL repeat containing protein n=2 Tax=Beijerinckia TaxID=532 RepID=B2IJQ0_BEII9|nr:conserved hypothetical protein [Beijerinckia indica subsp. indica ATCC 9039]